MEVKFQETEFQRREAVSRPRGLEGLVQRLGLARDAKGARQVLIATTIICFLAAGTVYYMSHPVQEAPKPSPLPSGAAPFM